VALDAGEFFAFSEGFGPMSVDSTVDTCFPIPKSGAVASCAQHFGALGRHSLSQVIDVGIPIALVMTTHAVDCASVIKAIQNLSMLAFGAIGCDFIFEVGVATGAFILKTGSA
jgi:hypothetical protein